MSVESVFPSWGDTIHLNSRWAVTWGMSPTVLQFGCAVYGYDVDDVPKPVRIMCITLYFATISVGVMHHQPLRLVPAVEPEAT